MEKPKIFVVDDDGLIRDVFTNSFKKEGFDADGAEDGSAAIRLMDLNNFVPDAVLTGITMTPMGGFEMIEEMQKNEKYKKTIYIVLSHRGKEEDKARAQSLGVRDFIISGMTPPDEVARRVKLMLGITNDYKLDIKINLGDNDAGRFMKDYPEFFSGSINNATLILTPTTEPGGSTFKAVFSKGSKLTN